MANDGSVFPFYHGKNNFHIFAKFENKRKLDWLQIWVDLDLKGCEQDGQRE